MRKFLDMMLVICVFACLGLVITFFTRHNDSGLENSFSGSFKVLDGDTLLNKGQKLRLIGIDAPEYKQKCENTKGSWLCGRAASKQLRKLVRNSVGLVCKGNKIDKYDRPLVTCYIDDLDINALMVSSGYAVAYGDYKTEERAAKSKKQGVWQGRFMRPQEWRRMYYSRKK